MWAMTIALLLSYYFQLCRQLAKVEPVDVAFGVLQWEIMSDGAKPCLPNIDFLRYEVVANNRSKQALK
jgi:hypothetical protein